MLFEVPDCLYHGSAEVFHHVDVGKGRPYKDFGKGFYMSVDRAQAVGMMHKKFSELASRRLEGSENRCRESLYRLVYDSELFKLLSDPATRLFLETNEELCGYYDVERTVGKPALYAAIV